MKTQCRIIDSTLRDGQQSLWATRMTTAMLLPALDTIDHAGLDAIEFMGTAVMDASVQHLKENPWDRFRLVRERIPQTPLVMINGCLGFSVGRGPMPDDMKALLFQVCAANGIDRFFVQDGLNDIRNFEVPIKAIRESGAEIMAAVTYSMSPVHTDAYFVERYKELLAWGVDYFVLKDPNGILTPSRIKTLIPAILTVTGETPLYLHSHCSTGLGPATNLEAVQLGVAGIWTAASPLANGTSLPATESMVSHLQRMGYETGVDLDVYAPFSEHFRRVAQRHQKPLGRPAEYDPSLYEHQMPGGMISNFQAQLATLGLEKRLDEVLEVIPVVRAELGWPPMVTPFSQIVGTQAALNILYGNYEVVLNDVEKLVLGHYGRTPAPIDPNVMDRVAKGRQPITERPGSYVEPAVERVRRERGPFESDEELLLSFLFMPSQLEAMRAAGPTKLSDTAATGQSLVDLVRQVAKYRDVQSFKLTMPM